MFARPSTWFPRASATSSNDKTAENSPKSYGSSTSTNPNHASGSRTDTPVVVDDPKNLLPRLGTTNTGPGKVAMATAAAAGAAGKNIGEGALSKAMQQLFPTLFPTQPSARSAIVVLVEAQDPLDMTQVVDFPEGAYWMAQDFDQEKTTLSTLLAEALSDVTGGRSKKDSTAIAAYLRAQNWTYSECTTAVDNEGRSLVAVRLPASVPLPTIPYYEFMTRVAEHQPGFRTPAREAFYALVSSLTPSTPIWTSARTLASELDKQTLMTYQELAKALSSIHIVADDTGNGPLKIYAMPNARAVSHITSFVGQLVLMGTLDRPSEQLYLSMLQRHDRYQATFHDAGPELLHLEYGPSQQHPDSHCLSAVLTSDPTTRMDVGTDSTFSKSLRSADPPLANLRRRLHAAVREETRVVRSESMVTSNPWCACCSVPLSNLREAQGLPPEDTKATALGTYDHVDTVAAISARYCEGLPAPELLLQAVPNHHLFRASTARDQVAAALRAEGAGRWVCDSCHVEATRVLNRETAANQELKLASGLPTADWTPPSMPELASWWVVATLGRSFGTIAPPLLEPSSYDAQLAQCESEIAHLEADNDALRDRLLQAEAPNQTPTSSLPSSFEAPSSGPILPEQEIWKRVVAYLPPLPENPTQQCILFAGAILTAHLLSVATGAVLGCPPPSPPPSPTTEGQDSTSSTQPTPLQLHSRAEERAGLERAWAEAEAEAEAEAAETRRMAAEAEAGAAEAAASQSRLFEQLTHTAPAPSPHSVPWHQYTQVEPAPSAQQGLVEEARFFFVNVDGGEYCVLGLKHEGRDFDGPGTTRQDSDETIQHTLRRGLRKDLDCHPSWIFKVEEAMEGCPLGHAACSLPPPNPLGPTHRHVHVWATRICKPEIDKPEWAPELTPVEGDVLEWRKLTDLVGDLNRRGLPEYAETIRQAVMVGASGGRTRPKVTPWSNLWIGTPLEVNNGSDDQEVQQHLERVPQPSGNPPPSLPPSPHGESSGYGPDGFFSSNALSTLFPSYSYFHSNGMCLPERGIRFDGKWMPTFSLPRFLYEHAMAAAAGPKHDPLSMKQVPWDEPTAPAASDAALAWPKSRFRNAALTREMLEAAVDRYEEAQAATMHAEARMHSNRNATSAYLQADGGLISSSRDAVHIHGVKIGLQQAHHNCVNAYAHAVMDQRLAYVRLAYTLHHYRRLMGRPTTLLELPDMAPWGPTVLLEEQPILDEWTALRRWRTEVMPDGPYTFEPPLGTFEEALNFASVFVNCPTRDGVEPWCSPSPDEQHYKNANPEYDVCDEPNPAFINILGRYRHHVPPPLDDWGDLQRQPDESVAHLARRLTDMYADRCIFNPAPVFGGVVQPSLQSDQRYQLAERIQVMLEGDPMSLEELTNAGADHPYWRAVHEPDPMPDGLVLDLLFLQKWSRMTAVERTGALACPFPLDDPPPSLPPSPPSSPTLELSEPDAADAPTPAALNALPVVDAVVEAYVLLRLAIHAAADGNLHLQLLNRLLYASGSTQIKTATQSAARAALRAIATKDDDESCWQGAGASYRSFSRWRAYFTDRLKAYDAAISSRTASLGPAELSTPLIGIPDDMMTHLPPRLADDIAASVALLRLAETPLRFEPFAAAAAGNAVEGNDHPPYDSNHTRPLVQPPLLPPSLDAPRIEDQMHSFSFNAGTNLALLDRQLAYDGDELPKPPSGMPRYAAESAVVELGLTEDPSQNALPSAEARMGMIELRRALQASLERYGAAKEASYAATQYRNERSREMQHTSRANAHATHAALARPGSPSFSREWSVTLQRLQQRHHDACAEYAHATVDERLAYNCVACLSSRYRLATGGTAVGFMEQALQDDREALVKFRATLPPGPHATDRPLYPPMSERLPRFLSPPSAGPSRSSRRAP